MRRVAPAEGMRGDVGGGVGWGWGGTDRREKKKGCGLVGGEEGVTAAAATTKARDAERRR